MPQPAPAVYASRMVLPPDAKGKGTSGSNREAESTDAPERGGPPRSSAESSVIEPERRGWVIAADWANWFAGSSPSFSGRRQPSRVIPGSTRQTRIKTHACPSLPDNGFSPLDDQKINQIKTVVVCQLLTHAAHQFALLL